jgi:ABC-type multidrug transport system ATPase subunit
MLILLDKPNVLILDEPDNDLDIDMLAVVESLLDTWPGTLLLITHDRHLMERVTDDQFALIDGKVRHVPGGVDEYLRLVDERSEGRAGAKPGKRNEGAAGRSGGASDPASRPVSARAEQYGLKKDLASTERKLDTLGRKAEAIRIELTEAGPSDYVALLDVQSRLHRIEQQISELEDEWVRLSERLS